VVPDVAGSNPVIHPTKKPPCESLAVFSYSVVSLLTIAVRKRRQRLRSNQAVLFVVVSPFGSRGHFYGRVTKLNRISFSIESTPIMIQDAEIFFISRGELFFKKDVYM
jgi:hypothetical protein